MLVTWVGPFCAYLWNSRKEEPGCLIPSTSFQTYLALGSSVVESGFGPSLSNSKSLARRVGRKANICPSFFWMSLPPESSQ